MRAKLIVAIFVSLAMALLAGCTASRAPAGQSETIVLTDHGDTAALEAELATQSKEVTDLNAEIDRLRSREAELTDQLKQALRSRPGKTISEKPKTADAATSPAAETTIKQLQDELKVERQKRVQLESQLAQLKRETSQPPIPPVAGVAPAQPIAPAPPVKQMAEAPLPEPPHPIAEAELPAERIEPAAPPPPAEPVADHATQIAPPPPHEVAQEVDRNLPASHGEEAVQIAALRTRGIEQETAHQEAMTSLAHVLDADRRRQEDLEAQLVALRSGAPGTEGAVTADTNEVHHLRSRLEEERRKNAELMAKLKLAGRVTDLVFRMQNQGSPPGVGAPRPQSVPPGAPRPPEVSQMARDPMGPDGPGPNSPHQPYTNEEGEVNQPIAPRARDFRGPDRVDGPDQLEVPQAEVPGVFPEGDVQTEETTQD